jgi:predicted enzyme related to lactoylglutathione lyase
MVRRCPLWNLRNANDHREGKPTQRWLSLIALMHETDRVIITSITVGIPVSDLATSSHWYSQVFELTGPSIEPVEGIAEYEIGGCWLQLIEEGSKPGGGVFRVGVADVEAERGRLERLGIEIGPTEQVESMLTYFEFDDPDGNHLSFYTVTSQ